MVVKRQINSTDTWGTVGNFYYVCLYELLSILSYRGLGEACRGLFNGCDHTEIQSCAGHPSGYRSSVFPLAKVNLRGNIVLISIFLNHSYTFSMPPELSAVTLPRPQLNSVKNKMAKAFMHGLNATVNYSFQESGQDFDSLGIDIKISSFLVGQNRTVASDINEINVQLKGVSENSRSMFSESDTDITYRLTRDLIQVQNMYLIVVVFPTDETYLDWSSIDERTLSLTARGYYKKVEGVIPGGQVTIPKANKLTYASYKGLFDQTIEDLI